jgi:UDP-2,3-diacylglucosamine pyrophosphatase LpxH
MPRKYKVVISDLHLGSGQPPGSLNPFESFYQDEKLVELLRYYSTDFYEDEDIELIIAGDLYDLLAVRVDGKFPERITEKLALEKLRLCIAGHPKVHAALRDFVRTPRKRITILPGNHDWELVFWRVQEALREAIAGSRVDARVQFVSDRERYEFDGVQIHHGMQLEAVNYHNFREPILRPRRGEPTLNIPWGSIFILKVITRFKEQRPYVDKVRPFPTFMLRSFIYDPLFAIKLTALTLFFFLKTRIFAWRGFGARLRQTWQMIRDADPYPDLKHKVKSLFDDHPEVHTIIMGHTHVPLVRRMGADRLYINTGCWTGTVFLDIENFGRESKLTYAVLEYKDGETRPTASLREWRGYHDLFREIHF